MLLVGSAAGFFVASSAERANERTTAAALNAPEGSAAREGAERSSSTAVPATRSTLAATTSLPLALSTASSTAASTTAPEGSPAREAAERARRNGATSTVASTSTTPAPTTTTVPSVATTSATEAAAGPATSGTSPSGGESLFGIRTESAATAAVVVVTLLVFALLVVVIADRRVLLATGAFVALLTLLDLREALHQHQEARTGLVAAALALAATHLVSSATAFSGFWRQ